MNNAKAKLAAVATAVALGGITGVALSQSGEPPTKAVAEKPAVRTKVIRRTIHVTKHAKPKHPPAGAPVVPGAGAGASGSSVVTGSSGGGGTEPVSVTTSSSGGGAGSETAPVSTGSSGTGSESVPVTTGASGAGGGSYESESRDDSGGGHEGGDD